ncbi:MAG: hypothetical protein CM15mP111_3380 [Hyphomicrobiales bacterium]|nr:MAG: hypothetical protein CM15mP111_3380 [Hyphomicrobiales bacterium]
MNKLPENIPATKIQKLSTLYAQPSYLQIISRTNLRVLLNKKLLQLQPKGAVMLWEHHLVQRILKTDPMHHKSITVTPKKITIAVQRYNYMTCDSEVSESCQACYKIAQT